MYVYTACSPQGKGSSEGKSEPQKESEKDSGDTPPEETKDIPKTEGGEQDEAPPKVC